MRLLVQRNGLVSESAARPTDPVQNLREGNLENPGLETALTAEACDVPEDLDENILGDIGGLSRIVEHAACYMVNPSVIITDEFVVGGILVCTQA